MKWENKQSKLGLIRPRPDVELFTRRTKLYFGSTEIKLRSSVGPSEVELRTGRTNQLNQ